MLTKERIDLLNSLGFSWGQQRPQEKSIQVSSSDESQSIEPLPFMPTKPTTSESIEENERAHVVSPQFLSLPLTNQVDDSTWRDQPSYSTYKWFNDFTGQEDAAPVKFNHEHVNFAIPSMASFAQDSEGYGRRDTVCSNESFQSFCPSNGGSMSKQVDTPRSITVWKCSVCRYAAFDTYDEALAHENNCADLYEGNFCRACAA